MSTVLDWSDVEACANDLANNHRRFDSFAWHERPDNDHEWAIVYTHNRDSGLLDQSNAAAIAEALKPFTEADNPDVVPEHHNHWACGWVDGYAIRVYRDEAVTHAFRTYCGLKERLAHYPVLDETDFSNREYDAALEAIEQEGSRLVKENAPKDWPGQVFSWLWDNDQREIENRDDQGPYPSRRAIKAALEGLGLLDEE